MQHEVRLSTLLLAADDDRVLLRLGSLVQVSGQVVRDPLVPLMLVAIAIKLTNFQLRARRRTSIITIVFIFCGYWLEGISQQILCKSSTTYSIMFGCLIPFLPGIPLLMLIVRR